MGDSWPIRPATLADAAAIADAERVCFGDPWSATGIAELFENKAVIALMAPAAGPEMSLAGYAFARVIALEAEILNIAVLPLFRRRRLGGRLLDAALAAAEQRGAIEVFLEVRESNDAARAMYLARGFRPVGVRTDYYQKPRENALILRLDLRPAFN